MTNDLSTSPPEAGETLLPRRQFLVLGSAAVATVAATSISADIVRSALVIEDTAPRLSIGFADASLEQFAQPSFAQPLIAATKLRSGDPALGDGVRIKVHGVVRQTPVPGERFSMALDAMYRVSGRAEAVPFLAWSYAPYTPAARSSNSFVVPVSAKQPHTLALSTSAVAAKTQNAKMQGVVNLSVGSRRGDNKLRRGIYFLAICPEGGKTPNWSSVYAVRSEDSWLPLLRQATVIGSEPVRFDYLVVTTDRV
jgi:hypothetical protein